MECPSPQSLPPHVLRLISFRVERWTVSKRFLESPYLVTVSGALPFLSLLPRPSVIPTADCKIVVDVSPWSQEQSRITVHLLFFSSVFRSCKLTCGSIFCVLTRPGLSAPLHESASQMICFVVLHHYRESYVTSPKYVDCMQSLVLCMYTKKLCAYKCHTLLKLSDIPDMRHGLYMQSPLEIPNRHHSVMLPAQMCLCPEC